MSASSSSFSLDGDASLWSHRSSSPDSSTSQSASKSSASFYLYGVTGGVLRLSPETPNEVLGLCTDSIATCFVVILVGNNGKTSLLHMAHPIHLPSIEKEQEWIGALENIYIVHNPAQSSIPLRLNQCCDDLKAAFGKEPICIEAPGGLEGGRIAYHRTDKACFVPDFATMERRSHAPNLNMYTYYLNGYFNDTKASFLQYDSKNWQTEIALEKEPLAIYMEPSCQLALKDDTSDNRIKLKNFLIRKALAQEPGYFFDIIRERIKENTASAVLDDVVKCFFIYVREAHARTQEIRQRFLANLDLQSLADEINAEAGWERVPGM